MAITYQIKAVKNPNGVSGTKYYAARTVKTQAQKLGCTSGKCK